ncbi:hypothetical protein [Sorangium sp. So ce388]|uniref:hypothetical protein n=1 Tax=Sorangium sp. So ce388 TaxID=3133309 RepID=UPI003F5C9BE0
MNAPAILALVAVCRSILGEGSIAEQDALAAAEAWAGGEVATEEEYDALRRRLGQDDRGDAVYWLLSAACEAEPRERAWLALQAAAALACLPGWDEQSVAALHADRMAAVSTALEAA